MRRIIRYNIKYNDRPSLFFTPLMDPPPTLGTIVIWLGLVEDISAKYIFFYLTTYDSFLQNFPVLVFFPSRLTLSPLESLPVSIQQHHWVSQGGGRRTAVPHGAQSAASGAKTRRRLFAHSLWAQRFNVCYISLPSVKMTAFINVI